MQRIDAKSDVAYNTIVTEGDRRLNNGNKEGLRAFAIDKSRIREIVAEQNRLMDFVPDPTATPAKARELMRACGVRAEDNIFSCGIIAARDEE